MLQNERGTRRLRPLGVAAMLLLAALLLGAARPVDEGMWTFDNLPLKQLKEKYNFTPTEAWIRHVQLASVRFNDGGSGSFVSPNGLVMTNHHVAVGQLQKISTAEHDYVATGLFAATAAAELKCPDLELNVLISTENVTARVFGAVAKGMSESEALKAREAEIAIIEKESLDKTGLRSNVINLYHGAEYWLYRYKRYTDIRLVFAPERQAAYFGGDSDNFTYPRYDLDVAFFRVYENGEPVKSEHYFKWNNAGAGQDDLVFVSGNPGSTDRLLTMAQLAYLRDTYYPMILKYIDARIQSLHEYGRAGHEQQRRALVQVFGLENTKKALTGRYQGLRDKELTARRAKSEDELRGAIAANPEWQKSYGDAWETIARITANQAAHEKQLFYHQLRGSVLASRAVALVQFATEIRKPDAERLDGYHEAQLQELKFSLLSKAPIYLDFEQAVLAGTLQAALDELGPDDPFLKLVLHGLAPAAASKALFSGTTLADPAAREALMNGGEKMINESTDPLIVLARKIDPLLRADEKWRKENIESLLNPAQEKIAKARFAVYGKSTYPDATFTLRLSYGTVKGYPMNGTIAPYKTTLYGLYDRTLSFDRSGEFALPERFWQRQAQLDLATPVNFVSTCDIIGGNSGSPVINRTAELVGLIFDGNIESLPGNFIYDDTRNRAVAVHSAYIMEALRHLYDAGSLADEIEGKSTNPN